MSARFEASGSAGRVLDGGHFIEWYDWSVYGFFAGVFAAQLAQDADFVFGPMSLAVSRTGSNFAAHLFELPSLPLRMTE